MNKLTFTLKSLPSSCYTCPFKIIGQFRAYCGIHPNTKEWQEVPKGGFRNDCPLRATEILDISEEVSCRYLREITVYKHWWCG